MPGAVIVDEVVFCCPRPNLIPVGGYALPGSDPISALKRAVRNVELIYFAIVRQHLQARACRGGARGAFPA